MDFLSIKLGKSNRFVISVTREPDRWECVDPNGKVIATARTKRGLKKVLKEMGIETD